MPYKTQIAIFFSQAKVEIVTFLIALFLPTVGSLLLVGFLIFADTFTGIWKAIKSGGWSGFESDPLKEGLVPKLILYPLAILIGSACELSFPSIPFIKAATFLLMAIELKSLIENINKILKINLFKYIRTYIAKGGKETAKQIMEEI